MSEIKEITIDKSNSYSINCIQTDSIYTVDGTNLEKILVDINNRENDLSEKITENSKQISDIVPSIENHENHLKYLDDHIFNEFSPRLTEQEVRFEKHEKDNTNILLFIIIYILVITVIFTYLIIQTLVIKETIKDLNDRQNMYNINEINDEEGMSEKIVHNYPEDYR